MVEFLLKETNGSNKRIGAGKDFKGIWSDAFSAASFQQKLTLDLSGTSQS
jgi:hypothetical protein